MSSKNITNLRLRLLDNEFQPTAPLRVFFPKPNGLQRPLSYLAIEDQIVLQAFTNIFAERIRPEFERLCGKSVFSNWLGDQENIFFLQDWEEGNRKLEERAVATYKKGNRWAVSFDLAAFYDTIDHDLLLKVAMPRGGSGRLNQLIKTCLNKWSSQSTSYNHGIPQGPIASSILSEGFLMSIDKTMNRLYKYLRYNDDIRIYGASEQEVRQAMVHLDILCKNKGLIPQVSKLEITRIKTLRELRANLPQVWDYAAQHAKNKKENQKPEDLVFKSIAKGGRIVKDRSTFRFGLLRATKNQRILRKVLRLIPHGPENIDFYIRYINLYETSSLIVSTCSMLLKQRIPYDYVIGELWKVIARLGTNKEKRALINLATRTIENEQAGRGAKVGAYSFLASCEKSGLGEYSNWAKRADSISLSFVAPYVDLTTTGGKKLGNAIFARKSPDPSLGLISNILKTGVRMTTFRLPDELPAPVLNTYQTLGLIKSAKKAIRNPIGRLLQRRYQVTTWSKWLEFLGKDYQLAHEILVQADGLFKINASSWLAGIDAFNELLTRSLQKVLHTNHLPGAVTLIDRKGRNVDIGVILSNQHFEKAFPSLVPILNTIHKRRSQVPITHPYDKPSGKRNIQVNVRERDKLKKVFCKSVIEVISIASPHI